ncbi:MAG: hypothetical protein HZB91_04080 [Elusimicrobia bacterium]|nr:hypothetical protein [Elusimicrobiota bacterium]
MKKMHVVFMFVAAVSAASQAKVWSEERARELPSYENVRASLRDLEGFRDRVRRDVPAESAKPQEAVRSETAACEAFALDGSQMRVKMFSSDTEITAPDGKLRAVLSHEGDELVLRSAAGGRMASAVVKSTRQGETAVISGCDGKALGSIEMAEDGDGDRSFVVKGADGAELASSGTSRARTPSRGPGSRSPTGATTGSTTATW